MTLSFGVVLSMIYEKLLQSTGKTMHATIAQIAGALTNIVLDPILIFALLGAPTCGLNNALIPLAAYNYGKGDKKRVHDTICFGVLDTVIIMLICMVVLEVFAGNIASVFALSPEILSLCKTAMSVIAAGYLFAGVNIAFQGIFQAMGRGSYSLVISLIRMVIICLPLAWIAVQYVPNKELVFAAFPIAELCGAVVSYLMYKNVKKLSL
jgi:Na+-driven multidrug efflux pump